VIAARDLGKLKTWSQAMAAALGGFAAAGAWDDSVGWWALLVALALTWISGLDYARTAPRVLRGKPAKVAGLRRPGGCYTTRRMPPSQRGSSRAESGRGRPRP
jgi:hypothetical protein